MAKSNCNIITPFRMLCLNNFPFIEEDFDAVDNYQLLSKIGGKLNEVIKNENNLNENFTNLYNAYLALKAYVDEYFDNLDIQEEINAKLDEMAESGVLADIIAQYIQLQGLLCYNTVAEMKSAENLVDGSFALTYGFHSYNDGGGAKYKIREVTNQDIVDEITIIALADDQLIAELIIDDYINVKQFGAYGDNTHDDNQTLQTAIDYALSSNKLNVKIPLGTYLFNELVIKENINVIGDNATLKVKDDVCVDNTANYYPIKMNDNTSIQGIVFDGNKDNNELYLVADIITTAGDNIIIKNNVFKNVIDSAIMLSESINSIIENNIIEDARDCGIYCNNNSSDKELFDTIRSNTIKNCVASAIAMKRGTRYITIIDNDLINCEFGITSEHANTTTDFAKEYNIINNRIIGNNQTYGIDTRGGYNSNINGNHIKGYKTPILVQGSHDLNILYNVIEYTASAEITQIFDGINLVGRSVTGYNICYNINICNNIFNLSFYNRSGSYRQDAIRVNSTDNTSGINIINNLININYGDGITTSSGVNDIVISGNVINAEQYAVALQGSNIYNNNKIIAGTENFSYAQKFVKDAYHSYYTAPSTAEPTINPTMVNGDVVFNKYGSSGTVFAYQLSNDNTWKKVSYDTE